MRQADALERKHLLSALARAECYPRRGIVQDSVDEPGDSIAGTVPAGWTVPRAGSGIRRTKHPWAAATVSEEPSCQSSTIQCLRITPRLKGRERCRLKTVSTQCWGGEQVRGRSPDKPAARNMAYSTSLRRRNAMENCVVRPGK